MAKCYKIVRRDDSGLKSFSEYMSIEVTYTPGVAANAAPLMAKQGYHLLAFDNFADAALFCSTISCPWEIWEAKGEDVQVPLPPLLFKNEINRILREHRVELDNAARLVWPQGPSWPKGTVMYRSITLIRRVDTGRVPEVEVFGLQ